jgi:hypothetical protein
MGSAGLCGRPGRLGARERRRILVVWWRRTARKMAARWAAKERRGVQPGKRRRVNSNWRWGWGGKNRPRVRLWYHVEYWANTTHPRWGVTFHYICRIRLGVQVIQYKTIYNTICLTQSLIGHVRLNQMWSNAWSVFILCSAILLCFLLLIV